MKEIRIFDTTLRDGEQSPGISLSTEDKVQIALQLEKLGVTCIEAGFPAISQGELNAVYAVAQAISISEVVALARCNIDDINKAWQAISHASKPMIHVFISTSPIHMKKKLGKMPEEVLSMIAESVSCAKSLCQRVEFSPEDATRTEFNFLIRAIEIAIKSGATVINIPDTVGYSYPEELFTLVSRLRKSIPRLGDDIILSVHCHNDLGLAVANSLAAVQAGANQVECTVNGLGERAGNASLEEIVALFYVRKDDLGFVLSAHCKEIEKTSSLVSRLTGYERPRCKAIVGENAFAHSSGIHTDGMAKDKTTYEVMSPETIGRDLSKTVIGKTTGRKGFKVRFRELGYVFSDEQIETVFCAFKKLATHKNDVGDDDAVALALDLLYATENGFKLIDFITDGSATDKNTFHALVRVESRGSVTSSFGVGDGQINALVNAANNALGISPELKGWLAGAIGEGSDAQAEVKVTICIDGHYSDGRSTGTDAIETSIRAYLNAVSRHEAKKILKQKSKSI